ncbi:DMT family transporter [Ectobacillus sp. sgz5001026]|uniref:DMT family transporter n=1 Tax=Ectobacillus sp. sgz5001026 TaxID=3242473 RepID=UPI0036D240BB
MSVKSLSVLLLLSSLWGASFIFMRIASPVLGPFFLIECRVGIAALFLLLYALLFKQQIHIKTKWKQYLILGAINAAIPFVLIATAELYLTSSLAAIINATTPLFTVIVSILWMKEQTSMRTYLSIGMGCLGVIILVGWSPLSLSGAILGSIIASCLAAFSYGFGGVYSKLAFKEASTLELAIGQQLGASVVLLPISLFFLPNRLPSSSVIFSVFALAIFCTAIGYLLFFYLIKNVGPTKTSSVTFLVPVFGILWGVTFLQESTNISMFVGLLVILASILLESKKKGKVVVRKALQKNV